MDKLLRRVQSLTPAQRELLRRRLHQQDLRQIESAAPQAKAPDDFVPQTARRKIEFSLFFFSAEGTGNCDEQYNLLIETALFADRNGFKAVWTPERHFQAFGGLYPNPSVLSASLAMITQHVQIRAGSLVLPLHSPVRVAEDWALVDNLSHGRIGISFATGWHEHDYVIAPENYQDRREVMFRDIEIVRRLWSGETVLLPGPRGKPTPVKTLPRPIQPILPVWVTVSKPPTWIRAGEIGANVLTSLITTSLEDLRQHIASYRQARLENGHDPRSGIVSLMLHTYLGADEHLIRERVREPLILYLQTYLDQLRPLMNGLADNSSTEMQSLLEFAFERYLQESSLLGTPSKCMNTIHKLSAADVDEIACLVDFGLDLETTMESLDLLAELRRSQHSQAPQTEEQVRRVF